MGVYTKRVTESCEFILVRPHIGLGLYINWWVNCLHPNLIDCINLHNPQQIQLYNNHCYKNNYDVTQNFIVQVLNCNV